MSTRQFFFIYYVTWFFLFDKILSYNLRKRMTISITTRITEVESLISEVNTAISAVISGGHQSYEIDTGQSSQGVKRLSLQQLRQFRKDLYEELNELNSLAGNNRASVTMRQDF